MKLSTGKVAFPIEFDNGDKAVIYFNPNDRGIQERIKNFESSVRERIKAIDIQKHKTKFNDKNGNEIDFSDPAKLLEMSPEDLKLLQDQAEVLNQIDIECNEAIKAELEVVFDSKISDVAFRYCQPLDVVVVEDENGNIKREMYIIHFMQWFMLELKKYSAENKSAMDKHLAKYSK